VKVSYLFAHEGEEHTAGGSLIKLCPVDMLAYMTDEEAPRKIQLLLSAENRS